MTLAAFNLAIDRFVSETIPAEALQLTRVVAAQALRGVVLKSPVDYGRFRAGWLVTVDARTDAQPPEVPASERKERRGNPSPSADAVINDGLAAMNGAQPFQSIILQNNLDYAEELERGGSRQAPQGVLAVTVAEIEAALA